MLTIRLMRFGRKHQPFYRLVVVPKRGKPDRAKYIEMVGWVDPLQHKHEVQAERVKYWMGHGAQPSNTAWNLFLKTGVVEGGKRLKGKRYMPKAQDPDQAGGQALAGQAEETPGESTEVVEAIAPAESEEAAAVPTEESMPGDEAVVAEAPAEEPSTPAEAAA